MLFASHIVEPTFLIKGFSELHRFTRNFPSGLSFSLAESKHTVELSALNLNERFYSDKYILSVFPEQSPGVAVFPPRNLFANAKAAMREISSEPTHEVGACINDDKPMGIISLISNAVGSWTHSFYTYCSFPINNARKIRKLFICPHNIPSFYGYQRTINNIKYHSERLTPEGAFSACDSLNSMETWRGRSEEISPPRNRSQK